MDIPQALLELGADSGRITAAQREKLDTDGYIILPGILSCDQISQMAAAIDPLFEEGGVGHDIDPGSEIFNNMENRGPVFDILYTHPVVLAAVAHVLKAEFRVLHASVRASKPGDGEQKLHSDWPVELAIPGEYQICLTAWLIDPFTLDNGSTRYIPGSHRGDPGPEIRFLAPAGSVIVFNAHGLHAGSYNSTDHYRRAILCKFARRDAEQKYWFQKRSMDARPELVARLSPAARYILDV